MDRLDAMRLFVSAVEDGSLAAAGRRHGHSPAAVTRAITMLERDAGETLLLRSTRRLRLTPLGERHLATYAAVLAAMEEIGPDAPAQAVRGTVTLTAPELFGRRAVMPLLDAFLDAHPDVRARVVLRNRLVNLVEEGLDLAVRLAPLRDTSLKAVRVGEVRTLICAAPRYLRARGTPATPTDLAQHACIGLNAAGDAELWSFATLTGAARRQQSVRITPRLGVDNAAAAIEAAQRGLGIVRARSYQVADAIADGGLHRLLRQHEGAPSPVNLLFPHERAGRRAVRALINHLAPGLRKHLSAVERQIAA